MMGIFSGFPMEHLGKLRKFRKARGRRPHTSSLQPPYHVWQFAFSVWLVTRVPFLGVGPSQQHKQV